MLDHCWTVCEYMPAYISLTRDTLIALSLAMHPRYAIYASKKQLKFYHMCLHLYVSVRICMYSARILHVFTRMCMYW
jgi:hypothetical protein